MEFGDIKPLDILLMGIFIALVVVFSAQICIL